MRLIFVVLSRLSNLYTTLVFINSLYWHAFNETIGFYLFIGLVNRELHWILLFVGSNLDLSVVQYVQFID